MADIAYNSEEERVESCIIVRQQEVSQPRNSTPRKVSTRQDPLAIYEKQSSARWAIKTPRAKKAVTAPAVKRPRGRPRKQRNNTQETAIILSDDERDDEETFQGLQLPSNKKRALSKLESSLAPGPTSKRAATSYASPAPFSAPAEINRLRKQLAFEQNLRADAEAKGQNIQQTLQNRDAAWNADIAQQIMPMQLQLQTLAGEKQSLESICRGLSARLEAALQGGQGSQKDGASCKNTAPKTGDMQNMEEELRTKDALIKSQATEIEELGEAEEAQSKELAEAIQKITMLNKTIEDLTIRHTAATNRVQDHENRIAQLQQELFGFKSIAAELEAPSEPESTNWEAGNATKAPSTPSKAAQAFAAADAQNTITALRQGLQACRDDVAALHQENNNLKATVASREKDAQHLCGAAVAREQELAHRGAAITALQHETDNLTTKITQLTADKTNLHNQLTAQKDLAQFQPDTITALEKELTFYKDTITTMRHQNQSLQIKLEEATTTAAQEESSLEQSLTTHQATITTLRREKKQMVESYKRTVNERADMKAKINKLTLSMVLKDSEATKLRLRLRQVEEKLRGAEAGESSFEREMEELKSQNVAFGEEIAQLKMELGEMLKQVEGMGKEMRVKEEALGRIKNIAEDAKAEPNA
ncbi:hypothetical protein N0V88_007373 [Collariella sp. IMI 366227]|nr:hypothetical protein N0V88_007373 [Collariella sp. IMI 366227]